MSPRRGIERTSGTTDRWRSGACPPARLTSRVVSSWGALGAPATPARRKPPVSPARWPYRGALSCWWRRWRHIVGGVVVGVALFITVPPVVWAIADLQQQIYDPPDEVQP